MSVQICKSNLQRLEASSDNSKTSEEDSYSDDNIGSDLDSCKCDEEGPCDYHMTRQALTEFYRRQHAVSGKK
jgi:hypothetical protein